MDIKLEPRWDVLKKKSTVTLESHLRLVAVGLCVLASSTALAQTAVSPMHPPEPPVNLGETNFLDAQGGPGVLFEEIGDAYKSGSSVGAIGQVVDQSATNSISSAAHIALVSNRRLFGAFYGVEVLGIAAHVNAGDKGVAGGWANLTVSPLILQWKEQTLGKVHIDQRFVLDADVPIGTYNLAVGLNLNSNSYTVHPYYAVTVLPSRRLDSSLRFHYLWNSTNHAPSSQTMASSTQAGQAIHFNLTTGYLIGHGVWAGANGYYLKQITAPQINGISLRNSPEQVGAFGPGMLWRKGAYAISANGYHEVGAKNRANGNRVVLRVQFVLGKTPKNAP